MRIKETEQLNWLETIKEICPDQTKLIQYLRFDNERQITKMIGST